MDALQAFVERIADAVGVTPGATWVLAGIFVALAAGTVARLSHLHRLPEETGRSLVKRLRTWWIIAVVLAVVVVLGRPVAIGLMAATSVLALHEYLSLVPEHHRLRKVEPWAVLAAVLQYVWILLGWFVPFLVFIPVVTFLLLTTRVVLSRRPEGFVHATGTLQWGMLLLVYCISHVAWLLSLDPGGNPAGGVIGWFLFFVLITEFNDICQALWGRPFGRHKIIPEISPGKSWEGLAGAAACTVVLALVLAPLLTPLRGVPPRFEGTFLDADWLLPPWIVGIALLVSLAGFLGDITMSAVKRDVRVKDSGSVLPGQGGILDRVDSLTYTAPLFLHLVLFLYPS